MKGVAGAVLAGGASRRYGRDKAEEILAGRQLIDWSIAALEPHVETIFIVGHAHANHLEVADLPHEGMGPLGGLAGALAAAKEAGCTRLITLPCDTPNVPQALFGQLLAAEGPAFVEACPVIGIWPVTFAEPLVDYLRYHGPSAMRAWTDHIAAVRVGGDFNFDNVNEQADMEALRARRRAPPQDI